MPTPAARAGPGGAGCLHALALRTGGCPCPAAGLRKTMYPGAFVFGKGTIRSADAMLRASHFP